MINLTIINITGAIVLGKYILQFIDLIFNLKELWIPIGFHTIKEESWNYIEDMNKKELITKLWLKNYSSKRTKKENSITCSEIIWNIFIMFKKVKVRHN